MFRCRIASSFLTRTPLSHPFNPPSRSRSPFLLLRHSLSSSSTPNIPKKSRIGTIKGTLFGFLLGSTFAGGLSYFYVLDEYKTANELLTEDVDALRASILRIEQYVRSVEDKFAELQKSGELTKRR